MQRQIVVSSAPGGSDGRSRNVPPFFPGNGADGYQDTGKPSFDNFNAASSSSFHLPSIAIIMSHPYSLPPSDSTPLRSLVDFLEAYAPVQLAEEWDNVGLLAGDINMSCRRVMTCLTITPDTAQEAIDNRADLIVTHHPLPFRPLKKITTETTSGRLLWNLAAERIAIYSAHTAFDSAMCGINARLAQELELQNSGPLLPRSSTDVDLGAGRVGDIHPAVTIEAIAGRLSPILGLSILSAVGPRDRGISRVGIACGSGGSLLPAAISADCHLFITGEMTFHHCLEAESHGMCVLLTGHYASERFAMENLAMVISASFAGIEVWASRSERDPIWHRPLQAVKS